MGTQDLFRSRLDQIINMKHKHTRRGYIRKRPLTIYSYSVLVFLVCS